MNIINLENLDGIPQKYLSELTKFDSLFKTSMFIEDFENINEIKYLISKINTFCLNNSIIGYHYTRAFPSDILENGLICRTGREIRENFLKKYKHLFNAVELKKIMILWENYFCEKQTESRDKRIFFNFTKFGLKTSDAEPLLINFGGEQIFMPLISDESLSKKIKTLGKPLILKCKLSPKNIETFIDQPWGKIAISSYNKIKNKEAQQTDQDGYQTVNVSPLNIQIEEYKLRECLSINKWT
ncbi:hypothetical protein [Chryseobacterium gambrini]|uniref:hypothetical protein n=1 Tax=Chryseobacterium gambrini TaxID=373672 RepID=UPI0022F3DD18|nr:hypothetical protein [Chryseobacterium gambrini]WBX97994.1 hypothetical protein PE065_01775 [Chryseobacterium gambrini]